MDGLPESRVNYIAVLLGDVHDAWAPLFTIAEGGIILCWQKGLYSFYPGAANMCVIGHLTGNGQPPRGMAQPEFYRTEEPPTVVIAAVGALR